MENEEVVLSEDQWKLEAKAVIRDVREHVQDIFVSDLLCSSATEIYFNVTTLEGENSCIQLSAAGFRMVGLEHNRNDIRDGKCFETPYSLLNSVSSKFRESFGSALTKKLEGLK